MPDGRFPSRRSVVMARRGAVATSQPLAAAAGLEILRRGGNAADAAVATAATLAVVEPMSTGVGGDAFALVYDPRTRRVHALNASGRAPRAATVEFYRSRGFRTMPETGILSVTVPGAVDGWVALLEAFGTMTLADVLEPAIHYAREGFPVSERIAAAWAEKAELLLRHEAAARAYLIDGRPPRPGEVFRQPELAATLEAIAAGGRDEFYEGELARRIASYCREQGGLLTLDDLRQNRPEWQEPIATTYRGYQVYQCPPNGQGLVTLLALNILAGDDLAALGWDSPDVWHLAIEAIKLAFADGWAYIADPHYADVPVAALLSERYARARRALIDPHRAMTAATHGHPQSYDTVYLSVVDGEGRAVSFINSLYRPFGSGIVVEGTGICLQNRGALFSLDPAHPNALAPGKRPYHTIIPSLVLKDDEWLLCFGVMGGLMQPQGQLQVLLNLLDFGMDVQEALDAPRFRYLEGSRVWLEPGLDARVGQTLRARGHDACVPALGSADATGGFGGGQVILRDPRSGVLFAGSDPRKDGLAIGY
ncbi:MAG TPA: gamma-glutamyltransferase [Bacillota bacterium]